MSVRDNVPNLDIILARCVALMTVNKFIDRREMYTDPEQRLESQSQQIVSATLS